MGSSWNKSEEYYYWEINGGYLFEGNIDLLRVRSTGSNSYDAPRPVTWYKAYSGGRSFYTALGHNVSDYESNDDFRTMMQEAILWATGESNAVFSARMTPFAEKKVPEGKRVVQTFPNPVQDQLTVSLPEASTDNHYTVDLLGLDGTRRLTQTVTQPSTTLAVSGLPSGVYVLVVRGIRTTEKQLVIVE